MFYRVGVYFARNVFSWICLYLLIYCIDKSKLYKNQVLLICLEEKRLLFFNRFCNHGIGCFFCKLKEEVEMG